MKKGQRLGKYRIVRRIGSGGFADVYAAHDDVEGLRVALKLPHARFTRGDALDALLAEVRLGARLSHPNILSVKNAEFVDDRLVIAYPLGVETLTERLQRRLATATVLAFSEQLLDALAFAHDNRVIHCDVKPDNLLIMPDGRLCLTDFGIARIAYRTLRDGSGSGTVGYVAPEQALGRPSFRSDVFSAGLVIYRMLSGELPEWPYDWPPPGLPRARRRVDDERLAIIRRALEVRAPDRFADAGAMLRALSQSSRPAAEGQRRQQGARPSSRGDGRQAQQHEYLRQFRAVLPHDADCSACGGALSAAMRACPWCGRKRKRHSGKVRYPEQCGRCGRGVKLDWAYCPWCWGPGFTDVSSRSFSDKRYSAKCANPACERRKLIPFMRYCPWCHRKVARPWPLPGSLHRCSRCRNGVAGQYWSHCAWCAGALSKR